MSSYADIGRQGKFSLFFPLSLTAPADSIRRATSYWGLAPKFSLVSYKILGPSVLRFSRRNKAIIFLRDDDIVVK
jgi:hypothetical protein